MSHVFRRRFARRTFLRAGAVSIGLPLLDAMLPVGRSADVAASSPRRLVILERPLGTYSSYLFPQAAGLNYEATRFLKPLEVHRGRFTVFSGMSHPGYPNTHSSEFGLLTGVHPDGIKHPDEVHNTISLDQAAAEHIGKFTRVPYLLLGDMGAGLSYSRSGVPLPGETRRSNVFARLFIDGTPAEVAREVRRLDDGRSILDSVGEQLRSIERELGTADRRRLELLATSIREAEQSLSQDEAWAARPKPRVDQPLEPDANEWVGLTCQWYDLMFLALQTDSTCVIVHRVPEQLPATTIPGSELGEHDASHHGKDPRKIEQVALYEDAHHQLLNHLLTKLSESKEANGTLLDHTQVLSVSNLGDGSAHASTNLPVLLAGGGFKHAGHVAFNQTNNYPLANLYVRMLRQLGIESTTFGTSTGELAEIG